MIEQKLDQLAEYEAQKDASRLAMQEAIDAVYTPEIKAQVKAIEAEFAGRDEAVDENINTLRDEIKDLVLAHGETVKGTYYQAVYSKPRVSWDTKALDGYAAAHPEIEQFKTVGKPSISLRKI